MFAFGSLDQREQVAHVEVQRLALLVTVVARAAYQVELEALSAVPVFPACFANSLHPVCFHLILVEVGRVWLPVIELHGFLKIQMTGDPF